MSETVMSKGSSTHPLNGDIDPPLTLVSTDSDEDSLPDVFGRDSRAPEETIPTVVVEDAITMVISDKAPARARSRKAKVTRRILQESNSEQNESLSDIFNDTDVSSKNTSEDPGDTPIRNVEEEARIVTPFLLKTVELDCELFDDVDDQPKVLEDGVADSDLETMAGSTGTNGEVLMEGLEPESVIVESDKEDNGIGGSCEGSPLRQSSRKTGKEESGDEEMECGSIGSSDADQSRRKKGKGAESAARPLIDASPDEGVVNSSDNEEVSPSASKGRDTTGLVNKEEEEGRGNVEEVGEVGDEQESVRPSKKLKSRKLVSNQPESKVQNTMGLLNKEGKEGSSNVEEMEGVGDEQDVVRQSRKPKNRELASSQSESEMVGSPANEVMERCREESQKNRLKIVVKASPIKIGERTKVNEEDTSGIEDGKEQEEEIVGKKVDDKEEEPSEEKQKDEKEGLNEMVAEKRKTEKQIKEEASDVDQSGHSKKPKSKKKSVKVPSRDTSSQESTDESTANDFLQDFKGIRCTSCNEQLNQYNRKSLCKHPTLGVLICRRCIEYYYEGEFTKDEWGSDEQCQWCGEGGNLICCDKCPAAFCKSCICRNLSRKEWTKISLNESVDWQCYICHKEPLRELIRSCKSVIKWADRNKRKEAPKETVKRERQVPKLIIRPGKSAEQLQSFLEGEREDWTIFRDSLEEGKKWAEKKSKKKLVKAIRNIRTIRKYFKAYQDHFEHCLEEIMSSGELSGGEAATDSVTPDTGSKEGSQESLKDGEVKTESSATPQKDSIERSVRRLKTTPKRPSKDSISDDDASVIILEDSLMAIDPTDDALAGSDNDPKENKSEGSGQNDKPEKGNNDEVNDTQSRMSEGPRKSGESKGEGAAEEKVDDLEEKDIAQESEIMEGEKRKKKRKDAGNRNVEKDKPGTDDNSEKKMENGTVDKANKPVESNSIESNAIEGQYVGQDCDVFDNEDHSEELSGEKDGEAKGMSKSDNKEKKAKKGKRAQKGSKGSKSKEKTETKSTQDKESEDVCKEGKKEEMDDDDFEKLLMDEINSDVELDKKDEINSDVELDKSKEINSNVELDKSDEINSDVELDEVNKDVEKDKRKTPRSSQDNSEVKKVKSKSPSARRKLSTSYKRKPEKSVQDYIGNGSTSDTEVSLIDVDLADAIIRKSKKLQKRKPVNDFSDSDTDAEIEKVTKKKSRKRKKKTSSEDSETGSGEENPKKGKKQKRQKEGTSSSDIDDDIDQLDVIDALSGGSPQKKTKSGGSLDKSSQEDSSKKKETSKKKEKNKSESELSSSDDDEELPEINYDTDPEAFVKREEKKKAQKLENAEEDLAEKRLREELEDDESKKVSSDSSSDGKSDDEEGGKKSKGGGGGKGKGKKGSGKKGKKEENSSGSGDDDDKNDSQKEKAKSTKKAKVHRLLKSKLISSSSSSNSDEEWNPRKKKINDLLEKEDKSTESKKRGKKGKKRGGKKGKASDSDFKESDDSSSSSDSSVGKKKASKKRGSRNASQTSESEDELVRNVKKRKKGKGTQSESNHGSSDDFAAERNKPRSYAVKAKKKSRIKKIASSNSDTENEKGKEATRNGSASGSDFDESPTKGKARKKIRKVMSKKKLAQETRDAAEEERERRKRVLKRRQELIASEMDSPQKSSVLQEVILDKDLKTKKVILEVDKKLVKVLKPHQAKGIQFMFDCTFETLANADKPGSGCILAHCMGLGKTLQVIAFLHTIMTNEDANVETALVVAPLNTVLNWQAEFEKWQDGLDEEIDVYELASYKDNQSRADKLRQWHRDGGVMIMGYTMYRNLCFSRFVKRKKQKETFHRTLVDPGPNIVVCDEGHLLKNDATATAKAMNSIQTRRRICLTGTPLQNNLIEYHCMVQFVKPQLLGTRKEFSNRFVNPINNGQCADSSPYDVKLMKKRAHILHNLLSGSVQRKDYSALAPYLPPKYEYVVLIRLSPKQIELYEHYLRTQTRTEGTEGRATSLFKDYQVLMNVWTHPRLLKLAAIRTAKRKENEEMRSFIDDDNVTDVDTSDEERVYNDVKDSSEDELMSNIRAAKDADKESIKKETNGNSKEGKEKKEKGSNDDSTSEGGSDSDLEVIKTWSTRRTRGAEAEEPEIIPEAPKKHWFTELVNDEDDRKLEISGKLLVLFEILKLAAAVGEKVLLFSQSLLTLDVIEDILEDQALQNVVDKAEKRSIMLSTNEEIEIEMETYDTWTKGYDYFRIDGSTDASIRKAMCDKFNEKDNFRGRLFLVSTKAGSLGINLVAASRVIIFDACWNPSHDIQSIFRVYRFGQEKAVYIYRFIAQGTMEERIYDRQVTKQSLAQRVVDEHQVKRHFTFTELNELYNFEPDRLDDPNRKEAPTPILPKDFILAELLHCQKDWIVKYHEHDSLLVNEIEESLTEEERKAAWTEYEAEKEGRMQQQMAAQDGFPQGFNPGMMQPPPSMAMQLQQMAQGNRPPSAVFNLLHQQKALQQLAQYAQQNAVQRLPNQAGQQNQHNSVSLNQLFQMSQLNRGQPRPMGNRPPMRFPGPPQAGPAQQIQSYNMTTNRLLQQALASTRLHQGTMPGQGPTRIITVPPLPGQGQPPMMQRQQPMAQQGQPPMVQRQQPAAQPPPPKNSGSKPT